MEKDVQQGFVLQKELRKLFKEGWVQEEKVRKILELAEISLPNLNKKQKNPLNNFKTRILFNLEKEGKVFVYQEEQKEAVILVNKGFYDRNLIIKLKWNDEIGNHNLKYTIDKLQNNVYYEICQKEINLRIFGEEKFSNTELDVYLENPIEEETIAMHLWGYRNKYEKLLELCFFETTKVIPRILAKPEEARKRFEEVVCKIRKITQETKPFSNMEIEQSKNKGKIRIVEIVEKFIYEILKKKVEENIGKECFWIECSENEKTKITNWKVTYSGNYWLEIENDLVHFKVQKQPKNSKLVSQIKGLYKKHSKVRLFSEDFEKVEILLERKKLNLELQKKVTELEMRAREIYDSKNLQL